jgi:hypothetical protein
MEKDLVVIATQLAYTLQLSGDKRAAMETYQSVLLSGYVITREKTMYYVIDLCFYIIVYQITWL